MNLSRDVTGYVRCVECHALVLEEDEDDHVRWHVDVNDQFRRAFDAITSLDLRS